MAEDVLNISQAPEKKKARNEGARGQAPRQERNIYDIAIVGGGFAGLSLALALQHESRGRLKLVVIDPRIGSSPPQDSRASAIAAGARHLLEKIGAWPGEKFAQPILSMRITDSKLEDGVRPSLVNFTKKGHESEVFAHMVENNLLAQSLKKKFHEKNIPFIASGVAATAISGQARELSLDNGETVCTRLVAACDGARSKLRGEVKLQLIGRDYTQAALVTTIAHEREHNGEAIEHFLPAGPFAALPLTDDAQGRHRSSIVWTESKGDAARLLALPIEDLTSELAERLGHFWGKISIIAPVQSHPLSIKLARRFVAERLALVGDAAHVIHPIAGQGLNLGFRDIAALAEVIADALDLGLDIGAADVLERYQRWRRFDTLMMGLATDGLNTLFSRRSIALRGLRSAGLQMVDRIGPLKDFFIASAAGTLGDVPRLMR